MQTTIHNEKINSNSITLFLKLNGTKCNMECSYCYDHVSNFSVNDITEDKVTATIDYLSKFRNYKNVFIVFHGGEPLLSSHEDIAVILAYIKDSFTNNVHIQFQTNGTLLDDRWIMLFRKYTNILSVSISLDPSGNKDLRVYPDYTNRKNVIDNITINEHGKKVHKK